MIPVMNAAEALPRRSFARASTTRRPGSGGEFRTMSTLEIPSAKSKLVELNGIEPSTS